MPFASSEKRREYERRNHEHLAAAQRERRKRYQGTCDLCGAATDGSNGRDQAPRICWECAPAHYGPAWAAARRGHGSVVEPLLAFLAQPRRYTEISDHLGISRGQTGSTLHRLLSYGLITRVHRGVYVRADAA